MSSDDSRRGPEPAFRQAGIGMFATKSCMGCSTNRPVLGGKGAGLRWRCAACVKLKEAAK